MKKDSKQRLFEVMSRIDETFKPKLNEALGVDPKYTHFAVLKSNNNIVNGWDYRDYDPEELKTFKKDYFFTDIADMGIDPKIVAILTTQALRKRGINPFDFSYWNKDNAVFTNEDNLMGDKKITFKEIMSEFPGHAKQTNPVNSPQYIWYSKVLDFINGDNNVYEKEELIKFFQNNFLEMDYGILQTPAETVSWWLSPDQQEFIEGELNA